MDLLGEDDSTGVVVGLLREAGIKLSKMDIPPPVGRLKDEATRDVKEGRGDEVRGCVMLEMKGKGSWTVDGEGPALDGRGTELLADL